RRGLIGVGQPGVKRKQRHLYCKTNKDSGERKPRQFTCQQTGFAEASKSGKIESASRQINSEKREQHRHAAEKCVKEKLRRSAVPVFAAPYFDQQKRRDQAHSVEQAPENEIRRRERAVEGRLHYEHGRIARAAMRAWM